jgi:hypothetical protein
MYIKNWQGVIFAISQTSEEKQLTCTGTDCLYTSTAKTSQVAAAALATISLCSWQRMLRNNRRKGDMSSSQMDAKNIHVVQ